MSKERINNLLKFTEYDHLQPKQKPTSRTEIGGFAVLESLSLGDFLKNLSEKTGLSKKELKKLSVKKLEKLAKENDVCIECECEKDKKNENLLFEKKKPSAKQLAARKKFMEMIASKKKKKTEDSEE